MPGSRRPPTSERLFPDRPFVLEGDFNVENVKPVADDLAMRRRGWLAGEIKDLEDRSIELLSADCF